MKRIHSAGVALLGAIAVIGDWISFAITAVAVAMFVLVGVLTHRIGVLDGLHNYAVAMTVVAAVAVVSTGAAKILTRLR